MRIGVLTWKLHNFGTALQAYALVSYFNENGNICRLLNFSLPSREAIVQVNSVTLKKQLQRIWNRVSIEIKIRKNQKAYQAYRAERQLQNQKYNEFYEKIPHDSHTVHVSEQEYFSTNFDKIIVGSDQVWNPKYFCETYFLDFVEANMRYSYAPSIGVSDLTPEECKFLRKRLTTFKKISVREKTGQQLIANTIPNRDVTQVIDPTLLLTGEEWISRLHLNKKLTEKYILVYTLSDNKWYKNTIEKIRNVLKIDRVIFITSNDTLYFYDNVELVVDVGPKEFLELIYNAIYVVTDSFHGVCFSVNFQKDFICLERFRKNKVRGENSRVYDFLNDLGLSQRIMSEDNTADVDSVDYDSVNHVLAQLRQNSYCYIKEIMEEQSS